jgi:hypothetical protein
MKTIKLRIVNSILAVVVLIVASSACRKDEVTAPANFFTVDGVSKNITIAALSYAATPNTSGFGKATYRNEFAFVSEGLTLTGNKFSGKGDAIYLSINGATQTLDEGTYVFTGTELNAEPLQVWDGNTYLNFDTSTQIGEKLKFTAASLMVTKSGTVYTVNVKGTAGSKAIVAQFTGAITNIAK